MTTEPQEICPKCGQPCETRREWYWDEEDRHVKIVPVSYCCDAKMPSPTPPKTP